MLVFAWLFFCAQSLGDAITAISALPSGWSFSAFALLDGKVEIGTTRIPSNEFFIALIAIGVLETAHVLQHWGSIRARINRQWLVVRWAIYSLSLWILFLFGMYEESEFIYFVF